MSAKYQRKHDLVKSISKLDKDKHTLKSIDDVIKELKANLEAAYKIQESIQSISLAKYEDDDESDGSWVL